MLRASRSAAAAASGRFVRALCIVLSIAIVLVLTPLRGNAAETSVSMVRTPEGLQVVRGPVYATDGDVIATDAGDVGYAVQGQVADSARHQQWALDRLAAEAVWDVAEGAGQVIAVIDTGVDGSHPDLEGRLVDGWAADGGSALVDHHGHGTHVAGIAAAAANGVGTVGLAHAAAIMPLRVTDTSGVAFASDVAEAIVVAVDRGATVINLSLAGPQRSSVVAAAVEHATANGVVVIAAAGNEGRRANPTMYPAAEAGVIAVAATTETDQRAAYSSNGAYVDLAAPGSGIFSTRPNSTWGYASGTSMAAPLAAAAVAVVAAAGVSGPEAAQTLLDTAVDLGDPGADPQFGHGLVDAAAAARAVTGRAADAAPAAPTAGAAPREDGPGEPTGGEDAGRRPIVPESQPRRWAPPGGDQAPGTSRPHR